MALNRTFTQRDGARRVPARVVPCVLCGRTAHRLVGRDGYCDLHTVDAFAAAKSRLTPLPPGDPHGEETPRR